MIRLFESSQGRLLTTPEDQLDAMSLLYHMTRSSVRPRPSFMYIIEL